MNQAPKQPVTVSDVDMPFASMVVFMVKWALASIPAFLILALIGGVIACAMAAVGGVGAAALGHH